MKRLILISMMVLMMTGCASFNPFRGVSSPPDAPRKMGSWEQTSKPVVMGKDAQGEYIVAYENRYSASASETVPNLTLGQKIGRWFSGLSLAGLIFVAVSLLFFGGAPLIWVWSRFLKVRAALKRTVAGIEELNEADQDKVKVELSKTQNTEDKRYIAGIKSELKKTDLST